MAFRGTVDPLQKLYVTYYVSVHFSGKRVICFHQSLKGIWGSLLQKFRTNGLILWLAPFLGYMLSQPPFSFCSLSPHPLGVPGTHLWPSPRLQAPFPASY